MTKLLVIFIVLNILNVIIQTVKSLVTIKCGKGMAALTNAIAYGLYTVVLVYMNCDLTTLQKAVIVGGCNLIGVYAVKSLEERKTKDRMWKLEISCPNHHYDDIMGEIEFYNLSYNTYDINDKYFGINIYHKNKGDREKAKEILKKYDVRYFVTESRVL